MANGPAPDSWRIVPADIDHPNLQRLLRLHLDGMKSHSPADSVHALDLTGLKTPDISLYALWRDNDLLGMGALKALAADAGEIKSMRTDPGHLGRGVGRAMLEHLITEAVRRGYVRLSLETGSGEPFEAALNLYRRRGFLEGAAFGGYAATPFNRFFHLDLAAA